MQTIKKTPKPLIFLKNMQNEHFLALQKKHFSDTELIEDIRQFCKQKATADREYAQTMQKLIQGLMIKRNFPDRAKQESFEMDIWLIWKDILSQYDNMAMLKNNTAELLQKISDELKPIKINRLSTNKRILDQLKSLQVDLFGCVQEMFKAQKVYSEEEKQTHDVKIKADDAATKVRNKSTNLFNSMADLHRTSTKLSSRLSAYQTRSTAARNEYLFQLSAINAHLRSYFHTDLGDYAEIIDGSTYEKLKDVFITITTDEQNGYSNQSQTWLKLIQLSSTICRQYHWNAFLKANASFENSIEYKFQPVKADKIRLLIPPNSKEDTLGNVTKKLVKRLIVREHKIIGYEKEIKSLETGRATPPQSTLMSPAADSEVGVEDLISYNQEYVEHKVEELKFAIRKEKIEKYKIEACLLLLQSSGVKTEQILQDARVAVAAAAEMMKQSNRVSEFQYQTTTTSESMLEREIAEDQNLVNDEDSSGYSLSKFSEMSYHSNSISSSPNKSQTQLSERKHTDSSNSPTTSMHALNSASDNNDDHFDRESKASENEWIGDGGFGRAIAKYEFQADIAHIEELDLVVDEEVILLADTDTGGWIKVRSLLDGKEGIVPMSYLKIICKTQEIPKPLNEEPKQNNAHDNAEDFDSENYINLSDSYSKRIVKESPQKSMALICENDDLVRAKYTFMGSSSDELNLVKDDIIKVISRVSNDGVDDGWWEGYKISWNENNSTWSIDQRGFFPSMVVVSYKHQKTSLPDKVRYSPDVISTAAFSTITEKKRPSIKLDFRKLELLKDDVQVQDKTATTADTIGDYVRLASENEGEIHDPQFHPDLKQL